MVSRGIESIFSYFGLAGSQPCPEGRSVRLEFSTGVAASPPPGDAGWMASYSGVEVWLAGSQLYVTAGTSVARLDPSSGTGTVATQPAPWARPEALDDAHVVMVVLILVILLRYHDLFALHAAALTRAGVGCLLVGESGAGKSTMALNLVRRGWGYLSDDSILLRPGADRVEAFGFRRRVSMEPLAARGFPEVSDQWRGCPFASVSKRYLQMSELYPRQMEDSCVPGLLIFPRLTDAPHSRLEPLCDKAEILGRLMQQSRLLVLEPHVAPQHLEVLKRLLLQSTSYELLAGRDLVETPGRISDLLSPLLSTSSEVPA